MSLIRIQQITETGKGIPRVKIRWPHYNRTTTFKVGDKIPSELEKPYIIEKIGDDFVVLSNGINKYKLYTKNEFRFNNGKIKQDQCYHLDKTIKLCEEIE